MIRLSYSVQSPKPERPNLDHVVAVVGLPRVSIWAITAVPPPPDEPDAAETYILTLTHESV